MSIFYLHISIFRAIKIYIVYDVRQTKQRKTNLTGKNNIILPVNGGLKNVVNGSAK